MPKDPSFFLDFTVVGKFMYDICDHVSVFAKASHDHNKINSSSDPSVMPGTSMTRAGGGFEFFPLKQNKDLRIHAVFCKTFGSNGNPDGADNDAALSAVGSARSCKTADGNGIVGVEEFIGTDDHLAHHVFANGSLFLNRCAADFEEVHFDIVGVANESASVIV